MRPTQLAKVISVSPWVAAAVMITGIYVTCIDNEWSLLTIYDYSISSLGGSTSPERGLFAGGFTLSCVIIMATTWIKTRLIVTFWGIKTSVIINVCAATTGCIMLMIMAWAPDDLHSTLHFTGAIGGILLLLVSETVDSVNWYRFCKHTNTMDGTVHCLCAYSAICVLSAASFFLTWLFTDVFKADVSSPWSEWVGLLFIIMGYTPIQSAHGVYLYRYAKDKAGFMGPLAGPLIQN